MVVLIGSGYWLWRRKHPKAPRVVVRKYKSEVRLPAQPSIVEGFAERSSKIYPRSDPMAKSRAWLRVSSSGIEWYRSSRAKFEVDWAEIAKVRLTTVTDAAGEVIRVVDVFPSKEFRRRDVEMSGLWGVRRSAGQCHAADRTWGLSAAGGVQGVSGGGASRHPAWRSAG